MRLNVLNDLLSNCISIAKRFCSSITLALLSIFFVCNLYSANTKTVTASKTANSKEETKTTVTSPIELIAPTMAGIQEIVSPDSSKLVTPDLSKSVKSAKSYTERLAELNKDKTETAVKTYTLTVDAKVCVWGRSAEDAESYAFDSIRKYVGKKTKYQMKDATFTYDSTATSTSRQYIAQLRFNYKQVIPTNWYLETEMSTGFGKTYERAYMDAISKASSRANNVQKSADWQGSRSSVSDSSTEMGMIPYSYTFATVSTTIYCNVYFRYYMPK